MATLPPIAGAVWLGSTRSPDWAHVSLSTCLAALVFFAVFAAAAHLGLRH